MVCEVLADVVICAVVIGLEDVEFAVSVMIGCGVEAVMFGK
jgi:hypothetical protein